MTDRPHPQARSRAARAATGWAIRPRPARALGLVLAVLLAATGCDLAAPAPPPTTRPATGTARPPTPAFTPTPPAYQAAIDIGEQDYQDAVARWRRQQVTAYQITISEISLNSQNGYPLTMRVADGHITVLRDPIFGPPGTQTVRSGQDIDQFYQQYTVEGLLGRVRDMLAEVAQGPHSPYHLPMQYRVTFEPTLGYPTYLGQGCIEPDPSALLYVCPSDTSVEQHITNLTVLATAVPGSPAPTAPATP